MVSKKELIYFHFSLKAGILNEYQFITTNPVSAKIYLMQVSHYCKEASVLCIIMQEGICHQLVCICLNGSYYCTDKEGLNTLRLMIALKLPD